jgi:class 3 adenylate cyclase
MILNRQTILALIFLYLLHGVVYGQSNVTLDSLAEVYALGTYDSDEELAVLRALAIGHMSDSEKKLFYSNALITASKEQDSINAEISGYTELGNALVLKGDMNAGLQNYITAIELATEHGDQEALGWLYLSMGDVLAEIDNLDAAKAYFKKGIDILKTGTDSVNLASAYLNLGDLLFNLDQLDSALHYTLLSETLFSALQHDLGLAYSLGNKGMIYAKFNKDGIAESEMNKGMTIMEHLGVYDPIPVYLIHLSDLFLANGDIKRALSHAQRALDIAKTYGFKDQASDAAYQLHEVYDRQDNAVLSLKYYKEYVLYRDSVTNLTSIQQMADMRSDFEISQKQIEVDLLNQEKKNKQLANNAMKVILGLITLILLTLIWFYKSISKQKDRADSLLLNILPNETAAELKKTGAVKAKRFDSVSVLFTDFKGFTKYSSTLSPEELVKSLDLYFSKFDQLVEKYKLEKIKTIGDSYMCSGGLPFVTDDHAVKIVRLALDMLAFTEAELKSENKEGRFAIRIGVHTGPVVAGVVGFKKFAYDIWGDTVNIASRMETYSDAGRINISKHTYELVKDYFDCEYRGVINVKNKGPMDMYFVNGLNTISP